MGLYPGGPPRGGDKGRSGGNLLKAITDAMKGYSRYASEGKGLTDAATRAYASTLTGSARKRYVTHQSNGLKAIGSFQVIGHTAATLGYGGEGLRTAPVTHQWSVGAGKTGGQYDIYRDGLIFTGGTVGQRKEMIDATMTGRAYIPIQSMSAKPQGNYGSSQYGGISTGYGQGYPSWVMQMMGKSALGKPPESEGGSVIPLSLALVALKVLL